MGARVPVRIRGVVYPSVTAAAAAAGVKPCTISSHLARKGHADSAGLGNASPGRNSIPRRVKPVTIHGRDYPSVKAAADALGVGYSWLRKALTLNRPTDWHDRLLGALMAADARQSAAALRNADMIDTVRKAAA